MTLDEIKIQILEALSTLYEKDIDLIVHQMEWSCAHRLAVYLETTLGKNWHVDCEYNKMGSRMLTKRNDDGKYKRPDIIIHKRGKTNRESNLLVIEIKMDDSNLRDIDKLKSFTSSPNEQQIFQYQFGLSIRLLNQGPILEWYSNGILIECNQ